MKWIAWFCNRRTRKRETIRRKPEDYVDIQVYQGYDDTFSPGKIIQNKAPLERENASTMGVQVVANLENLPNDDEDEIALFASSSYDEETTSK